MLLRMLSEQQKHLTVCCCDSKSHVQQNFLLHVEMDFDVVLKVVMMIFYL